MPSAANLTMKSMIVKHGLTVSDVGKGELSAALEGLGLVTGVVLPPLAGALCKPPENDGFLLKIHEFVLTNHDLATKR